MERELHGRARIFGDDINTDYIITSRRKRESLDGHVLRQFLFETLDPQFAATVRPGDVIVAGRNFGCGSAMEVAVTVIQAAGIQAVLARSFSRSFFRNAINNGLLPVQCETTGLAEGAMLALCVQGDRIDVTDVASGRNIEAAPLTPIMAKILDAGGLVPFVRARNVAG